MFSRDYFEIVPTDEIGDKNISPVLRGDNTLGVELWAVRHVLVYAHQQILNDSSMPDPSEYLNHLLIVNLLHPEMTTAWNKRKALLRKGRMSADLEMKITKLALSRVPKCNEVFAHRRWVIQNNYLSGW